MTKKSLLTLLLGLLLFAPDLFAQQDTVRFSVNIRRLRQTGQIQTGDTLFAQIFTGVAGRYSQPGDSTRIGVVTATASDTVFTSVDRLLGSATIDSITYKFTYRNLAASRALTFEDGSDRVVVFRNPAAQRVNVSRYWNDNQTQGAPSRTRRLIFNADMSDLLSAGFAAPDTIGITGPFRNWTGTPPPLRRVGLGTTFSDTIAVTAEAGTSLVYKFKSFNNVNATRFTNDGWEIGPDRPFNFGNGTTDTVITPTPIRPVIAIRVSRNFNVRMIVDTRGRRNLLGRSIDSLRASGALTGNLDGLRFGVYLAGQGVFGAWPDWRDTSLLRLSSAPPAGQPIPSTQRFIFLDSSRTEPPGVFEAVVPATSTAFGPFKFGIFYRNIFNDPEPANGRIDNEGLVGADYLTTFSNNIPVGSTGTIRVTFAGGNATLNTPERDLATPVAREYRLEQNYPNPFNPTTTIRFAIPTNESVQLDVYNLLGQKVATLLNERLSAGTYTLPFNAAQFASGVYFYRLRAGTFMQTNKMMLVK